MKFANLYIKTKAALAADSAAKKQVNRKAMGAMFAVALLAFAMTPELAIAAPWDSAAQKVLDIFTGGLTRTLAIIAVIACGIAAMAGKLSWDWAIKIVLGIVLIFGSAAIVDYVISASAA